MSKTDYEKHVERAAQIIDPFAFAPQLSVTKLRRQDTARRKARAIFAADREAGYLTVKWPPDYDAIWANIQKNAPDTAKRRLSIHDFYQVIARVVAAIAEGKAVL